MSNTQIIYCWRDTLSDASRGSTFQFRQGDVITLLDEKPSRDDWVCGIVDESGAKGEFPTDTIYILPAIEKPPAEFLVIKSY